MVKEREFQNESVKEMSIVEKESGFEKEFEKKTSEKEESQQEKVSEVPFDKLQLQYLSDNRKF
ncbi:hypothetical protein J1N35_037526 [Gossypium stocksii]|uniref:Uncharacterized protein n=1 Tax=Gossypium stocksii TaxID=47602 RepID=A0A9D3ZLV8_9ROSI|nr:hypothetical protein J1N35_037526 [Gossypium stocksii]